MSGGVRVDVRSNIDRTIAEFRAFRGDVDKATYRALNRALDKVATETVREIRKEYNVRAGAIRAALRNRERARKGRLYARLVVEGVKLNLIDFAARWTPRTPVGASVKIRVKGPRQAIRGAFIAAATTNNARGGGSMGMRQVYKRVGLARLPIKVLKALSVPQAFANKAVLAALEKAAMETFEKNFAQQIRYLSGG